MTGNREISFGRNPEATSTWLASLQERPKPPSVNLIVNYLPSMLDTDCLKRQSARQVMDTLHDLSLSTRKGAGLLTTRDPQFWPGFVS